MNFACIVIYHIIISDMRTLNCSSSKISYQFIVTSCQLFLLRNFVILPGCYIYNFTTIQFNCYIYCPVRRHRRAFCEQQRSCYHFSYASVLCTLLWTVLCTSFSYAFKMDIFKIDTFWSFTVHFCLFWPPIAKKHPAYTFHNAYTCVTLRIQYMSQ